MNTMNQVVYWGRQVAARKLTLDPHPDTIYFVTFFSTRNGPIVLDLPAGEADGVFSSSRVTVWEMPLKIAGLLGADRAGGKYVVVPPGYTGIIPDGFVELRSDTFDGCAFVQTTLRSRTDIDVAQAVAHGKRMKVYPLADVGHPPPTLFVDVSDADVDSVFSHFVAPREHRTQVAGTRRRRLTLL